MASEIITGGVDGDGPEWPDIVHIKTENFEGTALPLYVMPGIRVLSAMGEEDIGSKMWQMFELFALSLNEGDEGLERLGLLDYGELNQCVAQWINRSNALGSRLHVELN
jgi:hypothetical protein